MDAGVGSLDLDFLHNCSVLTLSILRENGASMRERPQQDQRTPRMLIRNVIVLVAVSNGQGRVQSEWPGEEGQEGLTTEMLSAGGREAGPCTDCVRSRPGDAD